MIETVAYFALVCFTTTNASCHFIGPLANAAACAQVGATLKKKISTARVAQCDTYSVAMPASCGGKALCAQ